MASKAPDKVPSGPKLDALTAEKVFGWRNVHKHNDRGGGLYGKRQDKAGHWRLAKVPNYSTNPLRAYSIDERMKQLGRLDRYHKELSKTLAPKISPPTGHHRINVVVRQSKLWDSTARSFLYANREEKMNIEQVRRVLLWCTVINYGILLVWFLFFMLAHDSTHQLHGRWFRLSVDQFDMLHYAGMSVYKIGIVLLNLVSYIALHITKPRR